MVKARVDDVCTECFVGWYRGRAAGRPQLRGSLCTHQYVHTASYLELAV